MKVGLTYIASLQVRPIIPFKIYGKLTYLAPLHSIWTQIILQATVKSSPTPSLFTACVDGYFHGLEIILWPLLEYMHLPHPLFYQIWIIMDIRKVKTDQLTLLVCMPCPSVWSQIWKRKHQECILAFFAIDFYKINSKLNVKVLGIEVKQCLLWAQVSNFNLVKVGYYPLLPLAAIAFKVLHCLLLYILYISIVY